MQTIERKHYLIGALIIALAFVIQPFSLLYIQIKVAPQVAHMLGQDSGDDTGSGTTDAAGMEISTTDLKVRGNPDAPIYLVEFSDYQCPFCARFHDTPKEISADSNGKVAWAWKYFPLTQIHPDAHPAAVAAECVYKLGGNDKFWLFTDSLIANQQNLSDTLYKNESVRLGISPTQFAACLKDSAAAAVVDADQKEGEDLGINGTPNTYVVKNENGKLTILESISGALPKSTVTKILEKYSQ
jgi:protein-disulfide isomerase